MDRRTALGLTAACVLGGLSASAQQVLLIPNSGSGFDNVWAFDPFDGSLVDNNIIAADGIMQQVTKVVDTGSGIFMVDESADSVYRYSSSGVYQSTIASLAANGIDQPFSIAFSNNQLYVSVVQGLNPNTIQRFDLDGSNQVTWANVPGNPRDILFRAGDVLVGDSTNDDIHSFSFAGALGGTFHNSDGATGIDFPNQMVEQANGNILAAGFTAPFGIYEYDASGLQTNFWALNTSPRGVYRLGNGNILWAGGTRVGVIDPATGISVDIVNISGGSFRFISPSNIPAPGAAAALALAGLGSVRRRR